MLALNTQESQNKKSSNKRTDGRDGKNWESKSEKIFVSALPKNKKNTYALTENRCYEINLTKFRADGSVGA